MIRFDILSPERLDSFNYKNLVSFYGIYKNSNCVYYRYSLHLAAPIAASLPNDRSSRNSGIFNRKEL